MRWLTIVLAVGALAFAGAGCGGDDEASGDTDTVTITETAGTDETTDETTTDGTTDETGDAGGSGTFGPEECDELVNASVAFAQALAAAGQGVGVDDTSDVWESFADEAPLEIQDDIRILGDAYAQYVAAFADLDLEPGEVPTQEQALELAAAFASLDQANIAAASETISTWASANCPG